MSIGSRIEKRGWIDAHAQPLADRFGLHLSPGWSNALAALAVFTAVMVVVAIVTGEPLLLVFGASAWLLALAFHLWTTADDRSRA